MLSQEELENMQEEIDYDNLKKSDGIRIDFDEIEDVQDVVLDLLVSLTNREINFDPPEIMKIGMIIGIICRKQDKDLFDDHTLDKLKIITEPFYKDK